MSFKNFLLFNILVSISIIRCTSSKLLHEQEDITLELAQHLESSFETTKTTVASFSNKLIQNFNGLKHCANNKEENQLSSMYYPKSALINHRTKCFVEAWIPTALQPWYLK